MSMLDSAKAIRNLANLYRDMDAAARTLEEIGSLDQAATEARQAVTAAQTELANLRNQQDALSVKMHELRTSTEEQIADSLAELEKMADEAQQKALQTLANADNQALEIREAARAEADRLIASAKGRVTVLEQNIAGLKEQNAILQRQAVAARDDLKSIETKVAQARDELRKLL